MPSLYDNYKLTNSTAIPLYQGSNGPEALQIAAYQQQRYDAAKNAAADTLQASLSMQAMPQDAALAEEFITRARGSMDKWSSEGDWENKVDGVRSLGKEYAYTANALAAPLKQFQQWQQDELENKDKNLTPIQKSALKAKALKSYGGLKKDNFGRLVGSFNGQSVAKNIDIPEKVDAWLKGAVAAEGGSDVTTDNGEVKYRVGSEWKVMSADRVKNIIESGMATDPEYAAFVKQEGEIYGFMASQAIKPEDLTPEEGAEVQQLVNKGYTFEQAVEQTLSPAKQDQLNKTALNYGLQKYVFNNVTSTSERSIGAVATARKIREEEASANIATSIVQDALGNPATNWEDLNKAQTESTETRKSIGTNIDVMKNPVITSIGEGEWKTMSGADQEKAIKEYFDKQPAGATSYAQLQTYRAQYAAAEENLRKSQEAKDFVEAQTAVKEGTNLAEIRNAVKTRFVDNLPKEGSIKVKQAGKIVTMTMAQLKELAANSKAVSTGTVQVTALSEDLSAPTRNVSSNAVNITLKDGSLLTLNDYENGKISKAINSSYSFNKAFQDKVRANTKNAMSNYSQNLGVLTTNNKKVNDILIANIRAGEKTIFDVADNPIDPGNDVDAAVKAQIEAGNFDLIGTFTENKGAGTYFKVSVKDPKDPKAVPQTYRVNLSKMNTEGLADFYAQSAVKPDGTVDPDMLAGSRALRSGSAYNRINRTKMGTVATIKQRVPSGNGFKYVDVGKVEKSFINGVPSVLLLDANNNPVQDPMQQNQLQIGSYLDEIMNNSNYKVEF